MSKLRVLDLFSGIGGFSLGLERTGGFETVAFCEIEPFPRKVLAKHWPEIEIYNDVRTIPHIGGIDVVCGGYPCQPFSTAGKRQGDQDDRHLWPAMFSIIQRERPSWVIGENVAGHVSMGLDEVLSDLAAQGYSARPFIIPACATDAPHRRERVWIIAHSDSYVHAGRLANRKDTSSARGSEGCDEGQGGSPLGERVRAEFSAGCEALADTASQRQPRQGQPIQWSGEAENGKGQANKPFAVSQPRIWPTESGICRVANGIPQRLERLKALGNAVVPAVVERIGHAILEAEAA